MLVEIEFRRSLAYRFRESRREENNSFAEVSKNLARYKSEDNFVLKEERLVLNQD